MPENGYVSSSDGHSYGYWGNSWVAFWFSLLVTGTSNPWPRGSLWPRMAMNVAQHKVLNLLKTFFCSSVFISVCVFVYWTCGPRQLFFFQCGPETPKVWTPLMGSSVNLRLQVPSAPGWWCLCVRFMLRWGC